MANTRNVASLILSIGALTLSIVAFGIAHNQAELQKASARAATGAVIAAQQEKKADATVSSGEVVFVSSLVKATKIEPMEDTLSTVGPLREIEKRARQVEREEKDKDKSNKNGYKQTGERDAYSELYIPSAKIDVTLTNDSFQNDDMVDGAAIYLNSPVLASVKKGSAAYIFTPSGKQLDYVCIDAFNSQSENGTIVSDGADLIVYAYLEDGTTIRVARFSRN